MRTYTQEEKQAVIDRVIMYRKVKGDIMATSKIPTATTIPLESIENEQFFAVVIPGAKLTVEKQRAVDI